jgi:hypothetical protein
MTLPPATEKPGTGHLRAINLWRKLGYAIIFTIFIFIYAIFLTIFIFIGVLLVSPVRAEIGLPDSFEDYSLGNLNPQDAWTGTALSNIQVSNSYSYSGNQSVYISDTTDKYLEKSFASSSSGYLDFFVMVNSTTSLSNQTEFFLIESATAKIGITIINQSIYFQNSEGYNEFLSSLSLGNWEKIEIEWTGDSMVRFRVPGIAWSDWFENFSPFSYIDSFRIHTLAYTGANPVYLDLINTHALASSSCGVDDCGLCNSTSTCYAAGCHWQNDFCYWFSPATTTDFSIYYAANSSFATPTAFILGWVDFAKPFMENLGNWIGAFKEKFDLSDAALKGAELGDSIPISRGYLDLIDDFFDGLPVSEMFLTFLTILLLIVIFRVIKALVNFLKPI